MNGLGVEWNRKIIRCGGKRKMGGEIKEKTDKIKAIVG